MKSIEEKLSSVKTKNDTKSHIEINHIICKDCGHKLCIKACPANTYEEIDGEIKAAYENCLECGSCHVACEMQNIQWSNPESGTGITYRNS